MENCRNARGCFPLVAVQFKAEWYITAVLHRYKPNMNVKTNITLLDICLKRCFIRFSFHFEGVLLALRGCTSMFRGCSRTLKTPNSPTLIPVVFIYLSICIYRFTVWQSGNNLLSAVPRLAGLQSLLFEQCLTVAVSSGVLSKEEYYYARSEK